MEALKHPPKTSSAVVFCLPRRTRKSKDDILVVYSSNKRRRSSYSSSSCFTGNETSQRVLMNKSQQATATNTNNNGESKNAGNSCPVDFNAWQHMTRTVAHYERLEQIGEGTYGQVYRAKALDDGRIVALKKTRIHHGGYWGMPLQLIREIKILKRLQHPNLLKLIEVVTSKGVEHLDNDDPPAKNHQVKDKVADARESYKGNLFLVLEYVEHDLAALIDVAYQFTPVQIKCIFKQLLEALAFMHQNKYVRCLSDMTRVPFGLSIMRMNSLSSSSIIEPFFLPFSLPLFRYIEI